MPTLLGLSGSLRAGSYNTALLREIHWWQCTLHVTERGLGTTPMPVRTAADPDGTLLAFLQSTYEASADLARWDRAALERAGCRASALPPWIRRT